MNKIILVMVCILVIIGAIFTGIMISKPEKEETPENIKTKVAEEEILDECTDEYEEIRQNEILETNSEEEKISPNCSFIQKKYYQKCGHTSKKYLNIPEKLVNKTKKQLEEIYSDWQVENFTSNEVILFQKLEGECGEHYLVKDIDGKVTIFQITENGQEIEDECTGITTEYLTDTDKINMKNGIRVNGKEELNQLLEDFE